VFSNRTILSNKLAVILLFEKPSDIIFIEKMGRTIITKFSMEKNIMNEYECQCGHIWIDNANQGCPMCGNREDIIRRDYVIKQPEMFGHRHKGD
jgi:predicted RNA-binding Zn-ribbon protein involved in translation (DUF1610 family)